MIQDEMKKLWEGLSGGMEGIYQKYSQAKQAGETLYQNQLNEAKKELQAQQNAASAQAKIRGNNTQNALAAHGLSHSGESMQAKLMNDLMRNNAMNQAADRYGQTVRELSVNKQNADAQRDGQMLSEMTELGKDLYSLKLEEKKQEQEADATDRELSLKEKQYQSQNDLDTQKLQLEKDKLKEEGRQFDKEYDEEMKRVIQEYQDAIVELENSISRYEAQVNMKGQEGVVPDVKALDLYEQILEESRDGLSWWDVDDDKVQENYRQLVAEKVKKILEDTQINEDFRKALEVYARVGGYL